MSAVFTVKIDGAELPSSVVPLMIWASVETSQRLPDMFSLRFRDPERIVLADSHAKIGSKLVVSVANSAPVTASVNLIEAEITAVELEYDAGGTFTVIRGYDGAHRLFRERRTVAYPQTRASDVASQVASRAGLSVDQITATSTVFEVVSQAGQNDWEFLSQLARDTGCDLTVRGGKFSFVTTSGGTAEIELKWGENLTAFRSVLTSSQQISQVEVRGWDLAQKKACVGTAPAESSLISLATVTPKSVAEKFGGPSYVSTDVPYRTQNECDEAAKALANEKASAFAEFEGVTKGDPRLKAGTKVKLADLGEPFDGQYTITTSQHRFDPEQGYTTRVTVTGKQDRSLLGLASGGSRARNTPPGVVIAVVNDAKDPLHVGRVNLKFPWLSDDYVSDWARVVCQGAGNKRGWMAIPEVGDEVLVGFEMQDFDRPYVLGGLYNGVDKPPAGPNDLIDGSLGTVNRRSFVSRIGHRIDLLDQAGTKEGIRLATDDDKFLINIDKTNTTITIQSDGKVLIEGTQGITLDAKSSNLEMKASAIKMTAQQGVQMDGGGGAVAVKSSAAVTVEGMTVSVKGQTTAELKGSAMTTISGGLVKIN